MVAIAKLLTMINLCELLSSVRNDIDFESENQLISSDVLDSLDVVFIASEISADYGIDILAEEISAENFDSIDRINTYIIKKARL